MERGDSLPCRYLGQGERGTLGAGSSRLITHVVVHREHLVINLERVPGNHWLCYHHVTRLWIWLIDVKAMESLGKPRYLHVFVSDASPCLGDVGKWANGPKYGGVTGLEPLWAPSTYSWPQRQNHKVNQADGHNIELGQALKRCAICLI